MIDTTPTCLEHGHDCSICEEEDLDTMEAKEFLSEVKSWAWNLNIFEIYDSLQDRPRHVQRGLLCCAMKQFNDPSSLSQIVELASHLDVCLDEFDDDDDDDF